MAFRTSIDLNRGRIKIGHYHIETWLHEIPELIQGENLAPVAKWLGRQYKLPSGIADLVGIQANGDISMIEVKLFGITRADIWQTHRYARDIEQILGRKITTNKVHRILIGRGIRWDILDDARSLDIKVFSYSLIGGMGIYTGLTLEALWPEGILHHG
jgi:RecB family endonuclease NucS